MYKLCMTRSCKDTHSIVCRKHSKSCMLFQENSLLLFALKSLSKISSVWFYSLVHESENGHKDLTRGLFSSTIRKMEAQFPKSSKLQGNSKTSLVAGLNSTRGGGYIPSLWISRQRRPLHESLTLK